MKNDINPFEHILYEMEMYLVSYKAIPGIELLNQLVLNMILDSRAIHLRNLAVFFGKKKSGDYWHISDYVNDCSSISLITDERLWKDIKNYTSRATGHLLDYRLSDSYKEDTVQCYRRAYPIIIKAIRSAFEAFDTNIKQEYEDSWKDENIQMIVSFIKNDLLVQKSIITGVTTSI